MDTPVSPLPPPPPSLSRGATLYVVDDYARKMRSVRVVAVGAQRTRLERIQSPLGLTIPTIEARSRLTPEDAWNLFLAQRAEQVRLAEEALRTAKVQEVWAQRMRDDVFGRTR